ncbi:MAG: hypothetical protein JSS54_10080 [Proteobacteria bacterium]|nr:hypothetical protein [Pseudomonadota bacterium]MBS0269317.1 hypothetical protein [Pseudomonadota bacterium]
MKKEIALSIAVTSLMLTSAFAESPSTNGATAAAPAAKPHGGGKCASGKCGTEKFYSARKLDSDPNGVLVRARDGKCGMTGKGHDVTESTIDRLAQGVCGK